MDSKLFRLPTQPNLYASIAAAQPFSFTERQKFAETPAPDARYPGWAAPMSDGRLVTTYRNHCSQNVPTGKQYATKEWMTKNATELIRLSRQRLAQQTGAVYGIDAGTVPPPASIVNCARHDCERVATDAPGGIGQERGDSPAPELFGTWDPRQGRMTAPQALTSVTRKYEGGRNTPRGGEMR
jgi:hypothetical protein